MGAEVTAGGRHARRHKEIGDIDFCAPLLVDDPSYTDTRWRQLSDFHSSLEAGKQNQDDLIHNQKSFCFLLINLNENRIRFNIY